MGSGATIEGTAKNKNSISARLTAMNLLVSGATLLLACTAFFAFDVLSFRHNIVRTLSMEAQITASNSVSALAAKDSASASSTLSALSASSHVVSAGIYTPDDRLLAGYWRDAHGPFVPFIPIPQGKSETHQFSRSDLIVARAVQSSGKTLGTVVIESDLKELQERVFRYLSILTGVLCLSLIAALFISRISQRAISEPMTGLAETARRVIREKNYSVRASPSGGNDEVSTVIDSFNEMLAEIQLRDQALQKGRDELEQRVKQRTAELEERSRQVIEQAKLLDLANDAILVRTAEGKISYWNAGAERLYGWQREEALDRTPDEILHTEFPESLAQIMKRDHWVGELRQLKRDDTPIIVSSRWTTLHGKNGEPRGWLEINTDITVRRQAEERARRLSGRILSLQDAERRKIARELHDSLGQYLSALKINIDTLEESRKSAERLLTSSSQLLESCLSETRTISYLLHPPLLDEAGLVSAIRWFVDGFSQRSGISAHVVLPAEYQRLSEDTEIALFRVLQEGLTNVHRHSGSSNVDVNLSVDNHHVRLAIRDHGRGMTPKLLQFLREGQAEVGVGLAGMRERMHDLHGSLEIDSDTTGTLVVATVPLEGNVRKDPYRPQAIANVS
jgi:PAS domain S-box-containing protein